MKETIQKAPSLDDCIKFDMRFKKLPKREAIENLGYKSWHQAISDLILKGGNAKTIARKIHLSPNTVQVAFKRMGMTTESHQMRKPMVAKREAHAPAMRACSCCGKLTPNRMLCVTCMGKSDGEDVYRISL